MRTNVVVDDDLMESAIKQLRRNGRIPCFGFPDYKHSSRGGIRRGGHKNFKKYFIFVSSIYNFPCHKSDSPDPWPPLIDLWLN